MSLLEITVLIPLDVAVAVSHLNEPHATLGEPSRHQAHPSEVCVDRIIHSVELLRGEGLARQVLDERHGRLHPEGQLERVDPCFERCFGTARSLMFAVHRFESFELQPLYVAWQIGIVDVTDASLVRRNARIAERRSLIGRWQEGRSPVVDATVAKRRADRDERGEVGVVGSQTVTDPRTDARSNEVVAPRVELHHRAAVSRVGAVHRMDHAQVIDAARDVRKEFAHRQAALAVLLELPRRLQQVARRIELHARLGKRQRLAVVTIEQRLRIERVHLRRPAGHEQKDDSLGPREKMRRLRCERVEIVSRRRHDRIGPGLIREQR